MGTGRAQAAQTKAVQGESGQLAQRKREECWHQKTLVVLWFLSLVLTAREAYSHGSAFALWAFYLSVWLLLIPVFPRYERWLLPYCGLLVVALIFTVLAFVLPLWAFHKEMRRQKDAYAERADEIAGRINALQDELLATYDQEARRRLRAEVDTETRLYREIEAMPLWPVAPATRRRFTISNSLLTFPLVVRGLEQLGGIGDILRWLGTQISA